jgi:hypothetical protein
MAHPTVTATLDKSVYDAGDTMTLTVVYGGPDNPPGQGMQALHLVIDTSALTPPES